MHIWTIEKWVKHLQYDSYPYRRGLRLRFDQNVDPEVKRACKEFCQWLRKEYHFPVRVNVYMKGTMFIKAADGEDVSAVILCPYDLRQEPYIRISTGEYALLVRKWGKDNALGAILGSIVHELTHYFQWINGLNLTEIGEERQAKAYVEFILSEYEETKEHP